MSRDPRDPRDPRTRELRINDRIRAREIRVINEDGEMVGLMPPFRALELARERNLDLVEISPQASPPVCKIMDYGRYKYEQSKHENEVRKRQKTIEIKEIRLHPHTDAHDVEIRVKKIAEFLADGDKVKVNVQFRGREMFHPELGRKLLESIIALISSIAVIERSPNMEGRNMWMMLSRSPTWDPAKKPFSLKQTLAAEEQPDSTEEQSVSVAETSQE